LTQFENQEFWFAKNIPLLAEEGRLRGNQEAAKRERDSAKPWSVQRKVLGLNTFAELTIN